MKYGSGEITVGNEVHGSYEGMELHKIMQLGLHLLCNKFKRKKKGENTHTHTNKQTKQYISYHVYKPL